MGNVFMAIFFAVLIVIAAAGVYFYVLSSGKTRTGLDVYERVPHSELGKRDFDVHMRDTRIGDVFASFPEDKGPVVTAQSLAGEWDRFKVDRTQPQFRHGATHSFVG